MKLLMEHKVRLGVDMKKKEPLKDPETECLGGSSLQEENLEPAVSTNNCRALEFGFDVNIEKPIKPLKDPVLEDLTTEEAELIEESSPQKENLELAVCTDNSKTREALIRNLIAERKAEKAAEETQKTVSSKDCENRGIFSINRAYRKKQVENTGILRKIFRKVG